MAGEDSKFTFKGHFHITVFDADGTQIDERHIDNLILNRGRNQMTAILSGLAPSFGNATDKVNSIAIGNDATAAAATQTGILSLLQSHVCESITQTTTSVTNDTLRLQTVFSFPGSSANIQEIAVVTNPTPLTLPTITGVARSVVSPVITVPANGAITVIYTLQIS